MARNQDYYVAKAKMEDFPSLMKMSQDIYDGFDYVPHAYQAWIEQELVYGDRFSFGNK